MSLFSLFNISKSAMFASQSALTVTSHNIANVNTPGFSRREVVLETANVSSAYSDFLGSGVRVSTVKRHYDTFIRFQLLGQHQNYGRSFALNRALSHIEQVFNDVKDMGLSRSLTDYFNAWQEVSVHPEGQPQRTFLLQKAKALVQSTKHMEMNITKVLKDIEESISIITDRINIISSEIARLNQEIIQIEAGGQYGKAADLRDQRDLLLKELSEFINISYFEDKDGSLHIQAGMRNLVSGIYPNKLTINVVESKSNIFLEDINITPYIKRGQLGGFLDARSDIESAALRSLRKLIASLIKETNLIHRGGYGLDGSTGNDFFNPIQISTLDYSSGADITEAVVNNLSELTLDEYDIIFNSGDYIVLNRQTGAVTASGGYISGSPITFDGIRVVITGNVSDGDRFFISPLTDAIKNFGLLVSDYKKIAASLSNSALPGDNGNALRMVDMLSKGIPQLGSSFEIFYRGIVSRVGSMSRASSDSLKFDENLLNELKNRREAISGVSLDEEATNIIRFQRSFEAAARMIKVTDELLQTILNL